MSFRRAWLLLQEMNLSFDQPVARAATGGTGGGSLAGLQKIISEGVATPRNYRAAMPPMGGANLSADQLSAVAAYVWGLSHGAAR